MVLPRSSRATLLVVLAAVLLAVPVHGFAPVAQRTASATKYYWKQKTATTTTTATSNQQSSVVVSSPLFGATWASAKTGETDAAEVPSTTTSGLKDQKKQSLRKQIREEGGRFAFNTKYGALNPFAIYYGLVAIALGIPWFLALSLYQAFAWVTRGRLDKQRLIPILITHVWGTTLMRLTRCFPKIENADILKTFYQTKKPAMFVANHNSWMDIPFLGATIGWRNYKIIAKQELSRVPILGKAIKVGGNIMVARSDKRSQLNTLKLGMQYLKDGVILCTYPEGTRTRTNRLTKFKNGAFKMAQKVGAPVIPISIVGAAAVHPCHWMFPMRPARGVAKVVVHEPVASEGKTEEELAAAVREAMISGLPPEQRPEGE